MYISVGVITLQDNYVTLSLSQHPLQGMICCVFVVSQTPFNQLVNTRLVSTLFSTPWCNKTSFERQIDGERTSCLYGIYMQTH